MVRRGRPGDCMYFIASGEVEVRLEPQPVRLGPGTFFGEMALLERGPRTATVVTTLPTTLLILDVSAISTPSGAASKYPQCRRRQGRAAAPALLKAGHPATLNAGRAHYFSSLLILPHMSSYSKSIAFASLPRSRVEDDNIRRALFRRCELMGGAEQRRMRRNRQCREPEAEPGRVIGLARRPS